MLIACGIGMGWAQTTTIGLTQSLDDTNKTVGEKTWTSMENVTIESVIGANIKNITNDTKSRKVSLNGTQYEAKNSCWRKGVASVYTDQYLGYTLTVAPGYSLSISKISARILVADNTYNWYVEILDATGTQIYKSAEKKTTTSATQKVADNISLSGITGSPKVLLWVKQGGSTKYFVADQLTIDAEVTVDKRPSYTVTTSCVPENGGTVEPNGETLFTEGSDVNLTAKSNTGYKFVKWTIDGTDYTENPYTISNLSANHNAVATFEALPKITFTTENDELIKGSLPNTDFVEAGQSYTIPTAYHLTKDGYTLTGWNDGSKDYTIGEQVTITKDVTFTPIFIKNTIGFGDGEVTVKWSLSADKGAPVFKCEKANTYYVKKASINNTTIDAVMFIDATNGKFDNTGQSNRAQVNQGTKFTIPACPNMVVTLTYTNGTPTVNAMSFNNQDADKVDTKAKTLTYTYTGTENTLTITDNGQVLYPSMIAVKYPHTTKSYTLTTTDTDFYSLYLDYNATIPAGVTAYRGELSADETTLTVSEITLDFIPANYGVLVKSNEAGEFTFEEATSTGVMASDLKGVTEDTDITVLAAEPGKTVLTLGMKDGVAGFRQPAGTQIKANRAYLLVSSTNAAKGVKIAFDGETTGISDINAAKYEADAPVYDLTGRRVSADAKGLLIKNGKKFINKK